MAVSRSSDNVVMPDITEVSEADELSSGAERGESGSVLSSGIKGARHSNDSNGVINAPISLPVGTLITGTTFNVITSDQLPHFKPMLCVDNGFISASGVGEDLKPTHIVIQNQQSTTRQTHEDKAAAQSRNESNRSWAETVAMPVLPVRCKNTSAELHKHRFGSGGRGKCIKYGLEWYTPSEFEALCGRGSSKDWKRSIRFGGRTIQTLIDEGILTPHATSCTCGACCDDQSAMGPVRLFTPYKRRRRNFPDIDVKKKRGDRETNYKDSEIDNINQTSSDSHSKEAWQMLTEGLDSTGDYQILENNDTNNTDSTGLPDINGVLKRLDDISQSLVRLSSELKQCVEDVSAINTRQLERLEQERASALLAASVDAQVKAEIPLHNVENPDPKKVKYCGNCNREASAECSLCRRTPYCSTYCQKKDWTSHQLECLRPVSTITTDSQQQSIMLIVESQQQ